MCAGFSFKEIHFICTNVKNYFFILDNLAVLQDSTNHSSTLIMLRKKPLFFVRLAHVCKEGLNRFKKKKKSNYCVRGHGTSQSIVESEV